MAAPGESKAGTFCERCFAPLAEGEATCPDCGAPTAEALPGADTAVHRDLAQANLLRLRGDLDGSEKALLAVLRRYPNDPLAHEMLGEVCLEKGELDRAVEWFELALDLAPTSTEAKRRLEEARERLAARNTADTAETLGLPSARPAVAWAPFAVAGALVLLAAAIALWPRAAAPKPLVTTVVAPSAPVAQPTVTPDTTPLPTNATPLPTTSSGATNGTEEERKLLEALRAQTGSIRVQSALLDPRTQTLAVAFEVGTADDLKAAALVVGKAALSVAPTAMTASLHALRADRLVFAADLPRATMSNPDPLTNLWPAETTPAPFQNGMPPTTGSAPTGGTTSPTTTGSTTSGDAGTPPNGGTAPTGSGPSTTGATTGAASSPPATTGTARP